MLKAVGKAWKETIFSRVIFSSKALLRFLDSVSSPCLCDKMESGTFIRDLLLSAHLLPSPLLLRITVDQNLVLLVERLYSTIL
jgi:hypothetical protein